MLNISTRFIQVADAVAVRVAELLCAPVCITNRHGIVITSSDPSEIGRSLYQAKTGDVLTKFLRIPFYHEAEEADIYVGEPYSREVIPLRVAQALVELVIKQAIDQKQLFSRHELKNQLIHDLLLEPIQDEVVTLNRAKHLGIDLTQPRAVILIDAASFILDHHYQSCLTVQQKEAIYQQNTQTIIRSVVSFFHLPNDTICADLGEGKVCVLKASNTKNLDPWANYDDISEGLGSSWANLTALKRAADALLIRLRSDTGCAINIGIGRYHPGLQGLAKSYEDARVALSLGSRLLGYNRVHCLAELGIAAFVGVADETTKVDLAKYLLSPLDQDPELLSTLDVFFAENCCPSSTAKKLSIHRNTLSYRLDKITSLTGLEPRKFDDAVQMRLSLLLRSLKSTSVR